MVLKKIIVGFKLFLMFLFVLFFIDGSLSNVCLVIEVLDMSVDLYRVFEGNIVMCLFILYWI